MNEGIKHCPICNRKLQLLDRIFGVCFLCSYPLPEEWKEEAQEQFKRELEGEDE